MSFSEKFVRTAQRILPSPFTIAILLTAITLVLALVFTEPILDSKQSHFTQLLLHWEGGFFNFLEFAMQMMLILVLGHALALTRAADYLIQSLVKYCDSTAKAAALVTFITILLALFNWAFALVLGAIFARKVGENALKNNIPLNYPLIGAAGYSGMMVWHGGLSGSAPLKVAEAGHEFEAQIGIISFNETIFSTMNLVAILLLIVILPIAMFWLGSRVKSKPIYIKISENKILKPINEAKLEGAERLDHARILSFLLGSVMLFTSVYKVVFYPVLNGESFDWTFSFINPNYIIFLLFSLAILLHGSFFKFNQAITKGVGGSIGIMTQFPFYAGIMGIMIGSGLADLVSQFFVEISTSTTFPVFTFFSAGLVNIFVPSGGGQWLVQAPILIETSAQLQYPMSNSILALSYGDQVTNMLQPFWALPLLGVTGLKAKEILPYSLFLFLLGVLIFCTVLLLF